METISVNKFRENLRLFVERVITDHLPIKVTRRGGDDFIVISAEDWEREQETLFVLQNSDLIQQITASVSTHSQGLGYAPSPEELNEITGI